MSVEPIVKHCSELLELKPGEALARAREQHPQIGGFAVFPVYAPLEIIHAAGLMPVGLFGAGNQVEISHADSRFQSFICSIAKSTLELFLRDEMKDFEGAVFSSICDVARNLSSLVKRNVPDLYIEYLHLPQNMYSQQSLDYTRAEFERFRGKLSDRIGRPIHDDDIGTSLELYNRVRALTHAVYDHRKQHPRSITAAELATIVRAGTRMMPEDFAGLLDELRNAIQGRQTHARDCVDVIVEGAFCEQLPNGLIEVIEAAGCQVKDDDQAIGWRLFPADVEANGDPLGALAQAYLSASTYSSVRHDLNKPRTEGLLQRMTQSGAQAVVFAFAKFCEPALLDYVLFKQRLDEEGTPHLKLEFEEKMWAFESSRTEVEAFTESRLFD